MHERFPTRRQGERIIRGIGKALYLPLPFPTAPLTPKQRDFLHERAIAHWCLTSGTLGDDVAQRWLDLHRPVPADVLAAIEGHEP